MQTLVIAAQKGGSGKTTIAIHLAVAASANQRVILADTDPQRSLTEWARLRGDRSPEVFSVTASELPAFLDAAERDGIDLAVVDTAPHSSLDAAAILGRADMVIVPVRPTALDLMAVESTIALVRAAGKPAVAVLSAVPPRSPEAEDAEAILRRDYGIDVAPARIADRRAYSRALAAGLAVTEFARAAEARREVEGLNAWLHERMQSRNHTFMEAS